MYEVKGGDVPPYSKVFDTKKAALSYVGRRLAKCNRLVVLKRRKNL